MRKYICIKELFADKRIATVSPSIKLIKKDICSDGLYPVVSQDESFIIGYTNRADIKLQNPPYIVFGDHSECIKYIDFVFIQGADGIKIIKVNEDNCNPRFFYYALKCFYNKTGFYQRHFKLFLRTVVPDITKKEQDKIATILSTYDSQIENNKKRIKLLKQMAENLYKEWFVRFRFPGYESVEFEDGTPKGWSIEKLKQFITFYRGKSYSSDDIASGDYVLLSMNNIRPWGGYIRDDSRVYGGDFKDYQLLHKGDLIMSITDMTQDRRIIGYVGIFDEERSDCIMSTHLMKVVSEYNNYYLYGLFNFSLSRTISEYATGANVLGLTDKILKEIKALVPPQDLISVYGKTVKPIWEEIFLLKDEIANLIHQRDLLLPRLMSGKLSI